VQVGSSRKNTPEGPGEGQLVFGTLAQSFQTQSTVQKIHGSLSQTYLCKNIHTTPMPIMGQRPNNLWVFP
jgi:hypothetical protein